MSTLSAEMIRAFIAVRPNGVAHAGLVRVQRELRKALSSSSLRIKWTDPATFHITLLFLGDIPAADVPRIFQTLELTASGHRCFRSALGKPGVFKKSGAVWVGIDAPPALLELQKALAEALGFEPGRFHAHFTLGRIKAGKADQTFFQTLETANVEAIPFEIGSIELVQSELLPDGARHTVLGTAVLQK